MKVKVIRQSGLPIEVENLEKYKEEWREKFDSTIDRKVKKEINNDQVKLALDEIEADLRSKYACISEWDEIIGANNWKPVLEEFGFIAVNMDIETGQLVYIILDNIEGV